MGNVVTLVVSAVMLAVGLTGAASAQTNLIVNGDFELGNTGFLSDYTYYAGTGQLAYKQYTIRDDSDGWSSWWPDAEDHTPDPGVNMMLVNGYSTVPPETPYPYRVWEQTVSVTPDTVYIVSAWVATCSYTPPELEFFINDESVGTITAPETAGVWVQFVAQWESGVSTTATLRIVDNLREPDGNDFALDDISLVASSSSIPAVSEWGLVAMTLLLLTAGTILSVRRRHRVVA